MRGNPADGVPTPDPEVFAHSLIGMAALPDGNYRPRPESWITRRSRSCLALFQRATRQISGRYGPAMDDAWGLIR